MPFISKQIEGYQQALKEIEAKRSALIEELRPSFKDIFATFLNKYPLITEARWTQYTPYFNDGESCTFSVGDLELIYGDDRELYLCDEIVTGVPAQHHNGVLPDWMQEHREELLRTFGPDLIELRKDFFEVKQAFHSIPVDVMEGLFGDHVRVVVTTSGVEVDEYDHD